MRSFRIYCSVSIFTFALAVGFAVYTSVQPVFAQETTGAMLGTVKDSSGAVIPHAKVTASTSTMAGTKVVETDASGYYHFSNLPPGTYTLVVSANGFETVKRYGLIIEVGHVPTVDIALKVGSNVTVVEVNAEEAPEIDTTTVTTQYQHLSMRSSNTSRVGRSFQSVIQFAPAASNEPLMGNTTTERQRQRFSRQRQ